MVATFMYYALTTGAGLQTLGEEYCDIMQLNTQRRPAAAYWSSQQQQQQQQQQRQQPQSCPPLLHAQQCRSTQLLYQGLPAAHTRALLVLLQSLGPPLLDRLVASLDRAHGAAAMSDELTSFSSWDEYQQATAAEHQQHPQQSVCTLDSHPGTLSQQLQLHWQQAVQWLGPHWPSIKSWLLTLGRVHLAAFYLHGAYYEWTKRLLGVTYTSITASKEQRASYRVLGLMLVAQLVISAAMQAQPQLEALQHRVRQLPPSCAPQQAQEHVQQHAIVLPDQYDYSNSSLLKGPGILIPPNHSAAAGSDSDTVIVGTSVGRQCPLCLSQRTHPTCTPCGHVFCWHCIAQWCVEKPECPLCRTAVVPSQLVCVYHSDF
jgi:peroxin-10